MGSILRPGLDTEILLDLIRDDFESDCQTKKRLINTNQRAGSAEDGENKPPSAAAKPEEEQQQRPPNPVDQLSLEQLEDALFELADLWCPSISESEYCEFFDILEYKIKYVGQNDPGAYDLLH